MKTFYTLLLYCTRLELAYFRSVDHSSKHIAAWCEDERRWERALFNLEHPLHLP